MVKKGWDKESARHSMAKKFGKAPPYRKKKIVASLKTIPPKDKKKELTILSNERAIKLIQEARKQLEIHKRTNTYTGFVQANEKGWLAFKQKLSSKAGRSLVKSGQIKDFVRRNPEYYTVFKSAVMLHNQSLGGDILPPAEAIEPYLKDVERFIK